MNEIQTDWSQEWKERTLRTWACYRGLDCLDYWEDKDTAERYWKSRYLDGSLWAEGWIDKLNISPESRVLDVGSGPGVLTVPLAERTTWVTAVEPSVSMMEVMRERAAERGLTNIDLINKPWDDVVVSRDIQEGHYDIVVASCSLLMLDIRDSIEKMQLASSRYIHLIWFAGAPTWDVFAGQLWPALHQREYLPGPKCDVLFNVLYQMGIYPNIQSFQSSFRERFSSIDEAMAYYSPKYGAITSPQKDAMRKVLTNTLEEDNGFLSFIHRMKCMHIWWEKENS